MTNIFQKQQQQQQQYSKDRIAKLKSDSDGFSDLFLHQHFLYVLRNSQGDFYIHSHFSPRTQKVSLLYLKEQCVPLLNLNCLDSCDDRKKILCSFCCVYIVLIVQLV